jgi:hypothetical protein
LKDFDIRSSRNIALIDLPSYSPERNPKDRLNAAVKQAMSKCVPVRAKAKFRDEAHEYMMNEWA